LVPMRYRPSLVRKKLEAVEAVAWLCGELKCHSLLYNKIVP
jgi:hypothetical protein